MEELLASIKSLQQEIAELKEEVAAVKQDVKLWYTAPKGLIEETIGDDPEINDGL